MLKIIPLELATPFPEGTVNVFLAIGKTISLIDTGNPGEESFDQLKTEIHKHGIQIQDIDHILLTHIHIDHAGGVPLLQAEADLPVYVHEKALSAVYGGIQEFEREEAFYADFLKYCGAESLQQDFKRSYQEIKWRNVRFLKDGDVLPLGGENFEVVYVPGHSQTDILLWNSKTGDAFIGDHLIKPFSVNAFIEPPPFAERERPKPLLQYRNSLERIKQLPLKKIFPGHGELYFDHISLINKRLAEQEKRCSQILKILSNGEKTLLEINQEMYPRLRGSSIFLGLSQIQGHLDLLESRKLVRSESQEQVVKYNNKCNKMEKCR